MKQGDSYQVFIDGVQMSYTGTDAMKGPGGPGGPPRDFDPANLPEGFDPSKMENRGPRPDNKNMAPPEDFDDRFPEGMEPPQIPEGGFDNHNNPPAGEPRTDFYMNDMVNFFSGVTAAQ